MWISLIEIVNLHRLSNDDLNDRYNKCCNRNIMN